MDSKEKGLLYESRITVAAAQKTLTTTKDRNPEGTPTHLLRCIYYHASNPEACNALGHRDCKSAVCQMKSKSKEERKVLLKSLESEIVAAAVERLSIKGELYCVNSKCGRRDTNHFMFLILNYTFSSFREN